MGPPLRRAPAPDGSPRPSQCAGRYTAAPLPGQEAARDPGLRRRAQSVAGTAPVAAAPPRTFHTAVLRDCRR